MASQKNIKAKSETISAIEQKLTSSQLVIFMDYRGLTVKEVSELRKQLKAKQAGYHVYKNTLIARAMKENHALLDVSQYLIGPTAMVYHATDPVSPAKVLMDFSKTHDKLKIKGGILESVLISKDKITYLTSLPTREVLLSKLCGSLNAPIRSFAFVLNALPQKLVYAIEAVKKQKAS